MARLNRYYCTSITHLDRGKKINHFRFAHAKKKRAPTMAYQDGKVTAEALTKRLTHCGAEMFKKFDDLRTGRDTSMCVNALTAS